MYLCRIVSQRTMQTFALMKISETDMGYNHNLYIKLVYIIDVQMILVRNITLTINNNNYKHQNSFKIAFVSDI